MVYVDVANGVDGVDGVDDVGVDIIGAGVPVRSIGCVNGVDVGVCVLSGAEHFVPRIV